MDRANGAGPGSAASRAERFEDEKRRIIESCFSKKETDGSLLETYITHIRITEFSSHPTTPPPPQARTPDSEKPRVIIVAVRKSGRVRMHKSKENPNGTYSIGKTWNLDDLSHVECFTGPDTSPSHREWGGDTGFVVTLGKPYFWQAQTDKEKKFFIASLIKIYGKYTGGKIPELTGFDPKEEDQVLGASKRQAPTQTRPQISESTATQQTSSTPVTPATAVSEAARLRTQTPPVRALPNGTNSPGGSFDSTTSRDRPTATPRWMSQNNRSQDSIANSSTTKSEDVASLPPRSRNGMTGPGAFGRFGEVYRETSEPPKTPLPTPPQTRSQSRPPSRPSSQPRQDEKAPPERRRPPMDPARPEDRDLVPPPLMSPMVKKEPVAPPPRSASRASPRKDPVLQKPGPGSRAASFMDRDVISSATPPADTPKAEVAKPEAAAALKSPSTTSLPSSKAVSSAADEDNVTPPAPPADPEEDSRPGLGPMIKSKKSRGDIAGAFWKAANTASAFRPRPGGAGDRLRQAAQIKSPEGPDGITGVVPAPPKSFPREAKMPEDKPPDVKPPEPATAVPEPPKPPQRHSIVPDVKITVPEISQSGIKKGVVTEVKENKANEEQPPELPRRAIIAGNDAKYLQSLGIDSSMLDKRSGEFGKWLDYFGWVPGKQMRSLNVDDVKVDLDRELNKAQAGGWLARFHEEDERVDAIKHGIDLAMSECEELDNLLTLYSVELSTLSDDIAFIEAQGQGLQVQTANQKLLKKELESLLETCAITAADLEALRMAPLDDLRGLRDVETSLVTLFKAMMKIDPTLGANDPGKTGDKTLDSDQALGLNSDYSNMRIVQEKKDMYLQESNIFMRKLLGYMTLKFDEAYTTTKRALDGALSRKVDASHHDAGRDSLWAYSPMMLYARDVDLENWNRLLQVYQDKAQPVYKSEFQNVIAVWRKNARKLTGEEAELLFSSQVEKHQEGVATTARKLTVKRSQTIARALRSPLADGGSRNHADKGGGDSRSLPYEIFAGVVDDLLPLVEMEQNFIIDFFHATTLEQSDFADAVAAFPPRDRRGGDLRRHRLMEPDRELARRVTRSMEVIFSFLEQELQRLMEWAVGQDPLQGVGVLAVIEKKLADMIQSNQDYLNSLLQKLHGFLEGRFKKFVDEQIRAIEETKVKINKRKGVISFIRVFPSFSMAVENMIAGLDLNLPVRRLIDHEYDRILRSMFDSLKVIARENPAMGVSSAGADPEDKEALNFHILLIENMNHFMEETDIRSLEVLEEWQGQANSEYHEHMNLYLNAVMRRPLGKLLDHLENIETQLQSGKSPVAIAGQPSNSKGVFNKVLGNYDSKEARKGIEVLRKRVEKHFGDADDPALSRGLVTKVNKECENFYGEVEGRIGRVTTDVYGGDVLFEWPRMEVKAAFR